MSEYVDQPGPSDVISYLTSATIAQADLDAGCVTNGSFVLGLDLNGNPIASSTDSETVKAVQKNTVYFPMLLWK